MVRDCTVFFESIVHPFTVLCQQPSDSAGRSWAYLSMFRGSLERKDCTFEPRRLATSFTSATPPNSPKQRSEYRSKVAKRVVRSINRVRGRVYQPGIVISILNPWQTATAQQLVPFLPRLGDSPADRRSGRLDGRCVGLFHHGHRGGFGDQWDAAWRSALRSVRSETRLARTLSEMISSRPRSILSAIAADSSVVQGSWTYGIRNESVCRYNVWKVKVLMAVVGGSTSELARLLKCGAARRRASRVSRVESRGTHLSRCGGPEIVRSQRH